MTKPSRLLTDEDVREWCKGQGYHPQAWEYREYNREAQDIKTASILDAKYAQEKVAFAGSIYDEAICMARVKCQAKLKGIRNEGYKAGIQSVIDYLKNEIATQNKRSAGKPELKAHLNAVERCVLQTVINALEEAIWKGVGV